MPRALCRALPQRNSHFALSKVRVQREKIIRHGIVYPGRFAPLCLSPPSVSLTNLRAYFVQLATSPSALQGERALLCVCLALSFCDPRRVGDPLGVSLALPLSCARWLGSPTKHTSQNPRFALHAHKTKRSRETGDMQDLSLLHPREKRTAEGGR